MGSSLPEFDLEGDLAFRTADNRLVGGKRIALLRAIESEGSISAAARSVGLSYKAAWDSIESINSISKEKLVLSSVGGKGGGGASLSDAGRKLIQIYSRLEKEHNVFIRQLGESIGDFDHYYGMIKTLSVRTSARNQIPGVIHDIHSGSVSARVELSSPGGSLIHATVTRESIESLDLEVGKNAIAIIKANQILLSCDPMETSARNLLQGKIVRIVDGPVNSEISILTDEQTVLVSIITAESRKRLDLKKDDTVFALFKSSSVIIGVTD